MGKNGQMYATNTSCILWKVTATFSIDNIRAWRHWTCVTPALIEHMKVAFPQPEDIPGYSRLASQLQVQMRRSYAGGVQSKKDADDEPAAGPSSSARTTENV
jgi:hypothetical protein